MLGHMLNELAQVDAWLDDQVAPEYKAQPLAQDWARISKVIEELGEAINELILYTGQNPRKIRTPNDEAMLLELADTAITAMLAMLHFTKDPQRVGIILVDKTQAICRRMAAHRHEARRAQGFPVA